MSCWKPKLHLLLGCVAVLVMQPARVASAGEENHARLDYYLDAAGAEHPVKTPADWAERRKHILVGMQAAMGPLPDRSKLPPLDVKVIDQKPGDGFTRFKVSILSEKMDRIPAYLLIPSSHKTGERLPAILALHQTSPRGKGDLMGEGRANMAYAPELAKRGYVVLCPDYPSFGEYTYDFNADDYTSGTMKGIFNHMRCVDFLQSREEVDSQRIGVIGHSLGGHNSLFVAAFDERIKAIVSSCGWTPFHDYYGGKIQGWTSDRYMPSLKDTYKLDADRVPFDFYEVLAALAPRPFFSSSPAHDDNFNVEGVKKAEAGVRPIYELLGAKKDAFQIAYSGGVHEFTPELRKQAFDFLDAALATKPPTARGGANDDLSAELPRIAPHEPADALKTFNVHPGFQIEQVAAEPLVQSPVAIDFDENGRCFVSEMIDYSEQDKDRLGRVKMLEDTDGDGRFDKATVFAEGLSWPTAILCYDGGVFVGAPPDIFYLKDTNGDGKADVQKTVFTGFNRDNVQGLLNSFHWGLDNRIHGATSTVGGNVRRPNVPDAKPVNLGGRDFSFDPRLLDIRPESGGAQHGMSFDNWGRKFVCSNSDHIQMVMYEDGYSGRNPYVTAPPPRESIALDGPQAKVFRISPVEPWRIVRTRLRVTGVTPGIIEGGGQPAGYFTGATGTTLYRGDAFGPEYIGQAFVGDVGSNIVHRKVLEPKGVGFVAKRADEGKEFVASEDIWFRPAQFANAPDGSLYIIDVYREVIEHPHSLPPQIKKHLDLRSGADRGRLYRIKPDNFKQRPVPKLGDANTAELVATLAHPNGWHRDTAARLLYQRNDPAAVQLLDKLAADSPSPLGRMHAIYALAGQNALRAEVLIPRLADPEPGVRENAVRLAEPIAGTSVELAAKLIGLKDDPDLRVRYHLAFSLGPIPGPKRLEALEAILRHDPGDAYVRFAVFSSLRDDASEMLGTFLKDEAFRTSAPGKDVVAALSLQVGLKAAADEVLKTLQAIEALPANDPAASKAVVSLRQGLAKAGSPLQAKIGQSAKATQLIDDLLKDAVRMASDANAPVAKRVDAVRSLSLGALEKQSALLEKLLSNREPLEIQLAALRTLDAFTEPVVGEIVTRSWTGLTPRARVGATEVLFARPERLAPFLAAVEGGKIPAGDIDPARVRQLEAGGADGAIVERAKKASGPVAVRKRDDVIAAYRPALELKGDPAKGKLIFQKTCAACHRLEGVGQEIGPNLAAIQSRGAEAVLVNVLDPNREINPQFVDYMVTTKTGRTLTGVLASETQSSVTLRRAENATDTILRSEIKQMRSSKVSIMPEGLEQQFDVPGMADLIAYVMSVK